VQPSSIGTLQRGSRQVLYLAEPWDNSRVSCDCFSVITCVFARARYLAILTLYQVFLAISCSILQDHLFTPPLGALTYKFSEMTKGFGGRIHPRHVRSIHNSTQSDNKGSQPKRSQYTSQSWGQQQSSFRPPAPRAEAPGALVEDLGISLERSTAYSVVRTRAILQECAKSPFRSKRR
jgi:hypothetical protein